MIPNLLLTAIAFTTLLPAAIAVGAEGSCPQDGSHATRVVFDTDMYGDVDDVLALAALHALHSRREIEVLAITIGTEANWVAPYTVSPNGGAEFTEVEGGRHRILLLSESQREKTLDAMTLLVSQPPARKIP